ncbi:hypothetical protein TNCV_3016291 [Trichonephila clavipes]|nr:hypothetical protein TNCV_3016291 [Trichonephila clavipes]
MLVPLPHVGLSRPLRGAPHSLRNAALGATGELLVINLAISTTVRYKYFNKLYVAYLGVSRQTDHLIGTFAHAPQGPSELGTVGFGHHELSRH